MINCENIAFNLQYCLSLKYFINSYCKNKNFVTIEKQYYKNFICSTKPCIMSDQIPTSLIFATNNPNKLEELRCILPDYAILGLKDVGIDEDIPETGATLEENAIIKAQYLFDISGKPSFAEDTGLEVFALDGAPGVHTARYAGDERDPNKNMDLLLQNLMDKVDRTARFRTVIAYISNQGRELFEGIVTGTIAYEKSGIGGFGYDPAFIPDGYDKTFASLSKEIKNNISHRARAVQALIDHLQQHI